VEELKAGRLPPAMQPLVQQLFKPTRTASNTRRWKRPAPNCTARRSG
jgi:hypothetical protein